MYGSEKVKFLITFRNIKKYKFMDYATMTERDDFCGTRNLLISNLIWESLYINTEQSIRSYFHDF